ncbi:escape protein-like protein 2 [Mollisia scopiformis]|uniref:Mitochondrial escape protein 2 n=1 Tax=Mollisia scopiformis TaxID=149040 RepID=A0A194XP33_MOLSC|nr:escape protein-like protein 2 [Mollisia scopiformis]KUJ21839.1 escape protein-like protein 2 [Mollisia scopiformis]
MQTSRRIFFNPTSLPGLRTKPQRRDFYHGGSTPRPRVGLRKDVWRGIRRESTETGEDQSGHIAAGFNEGILFFDNLFPLKLTWLLRYPLRSERNLPDLLNRFHSQTLSVLDPIGLVKQAIPASVPLKITEILPRLKDGGAFVKFSHPDAVTAKEVEGLVGRYLEENPVKPWFSPFRGIRTKLVVGKPWLEDLHRFPSCRIKVEFVPTSPGGQAAELSQETLYSLFRKYGKLAEITSQASDSKVLPKFAYLDFARLRHSIMARNCMHGIKISEAQGGGAAGTELRLSYEQKLKTHWIWDWLLNHPRVVIPAIAALTAIIAAAVFDPMRTFFIRAHVEHAFHLKDNKIYKWFKNQAGDIFTFRLHRGEEASLGAIFDDRKEVIDQLRTWLMETAETFIIIQGPRGSGKKEVLDEALKGRPNILNLDCKRIVEARGDSATISTLASEVGYRPLFAILNSMSSLIDLASQATIGSKSGLSETLDSQLKKILETTATALKQVALSHRNKDDKDASLNDDDWLEAHPEFRPVIVVDNFKTDEVAVVYDKISEWAAALTTQNISHIIFLTNDISYSKPLTKALPDRVFREIVLGDLTPEVAKKFVVTHLDQDEHDPTGEAVKLSPSIKHRDLEELDECIAVLGGRLTDLEFLARRLKTGQTPKKALAEIIEQSASEIMKMYLLTLDKGDRKWSPEQAWFLVKSLAEQENLRYNEVLLSNTFASSLTAAATNGEGVLEALAAAELISIKTHNGRPATILPGKPLLRESFKKIVDDTALRSRLDLAVLKELITIETKSIDKYENELTMLGGLPRQRELGPRIQFLLTNLAASQQKVEAWTKEVGALKKILAKEY